ncbi:hypothetical protein Tco_0743757 [Tanacetum coccineum]
MNLWIVDATGLELQPDRLHLNMLSYKLWIGGTTFAVVSEAAKRIGSQWSDTFLTGLVDNTLFTKKRDHISSLSKFTWMTSSARRVRDEHDGKLLTTPKSTPPLLTSPPLAPTQPSITSSPLAINLDPVDLIFSTPPTSPHHFFDSLEDLPVRTTNPPPRSSFESIKCLANQPPPLPAMEPPLPPLPP